MCELTSKDVNILQGCWRYTIVSASLYPPHGNWFSCSISDAVSKINIFVREIPIEKKILTSVFKGSVYFW